MDKQAMKEWIDFVDDPKASLLQELQKMNEYLKMMCDKEMPETDMTEMNDCMNKMSVMMGQILEKMNEPDEQVNINVQLDLK